VEKERGNDGGRVRMNCCRCLDSPPSLDSPRLIHKASRKSKRERKEGGVFGRARWGERGGGGREREGGGMGEREGDLKRDGVGAKQLTNNANKVIELVRPFA
jgi:hypothetical protein